MNVDDARRISDLRAALKRSKADALLSLEDVALLWGTAKSRFVTVRNQIADFPAPIPAPKAMGLPPKAYAYPARPAIEAMLAYANRHDDLDRAKAERTALILGQRRGRDDQTPLHKVNELQVLNRLAAELEARERAQGEYVASADVASVAGEVFSEISDFFATLSNKIDPHGELPPEVRKLVDDLGSSALLRLHGRMKDMLDSDAVTETNRDQADRAGKSPTRRVGKGRVRRKAG